MTLNPCGASSGTNLDLFKDDIAANEGPLNLGTLNSHPVILAHDDDYGEQVELYAYVDLDTTLLRQRVGNVGDDYIIFFVEKGEGEYANGGVVFTFESEINLADDSASTLTDIAPLEGASTETEINQAQNFVDFVAEKSNEYATTVEAYNKETESSIVTKLEDIGYVFQTNFAHCIIDSCPMSNFVRKCTVLASAWIVNMHTCLVFPNTLQLEFFCIPHRKRPSC
ncbi:MAG TPA: hypothetical protein VJZ48_00245 [Bacilli bacterium]|nr:hypothetical protein [Bacilli bacterium]